MPTERCPVCDRADCKAYEWQCGEDFFTDHETIVAWGDDCDAHAVDWRARALKAEAERDEWRSLARRLLDAAESTILRDHATMSDPDVYEAACPFCGSASNDRTKEPHEADCVGEDARRLLTKGADRCSVR